MVMMITGTPTDRLMARSMRRSLRKRKKARNPKGKEMARSLATRTEMKRRARSQKTLIVRMKRKTILRKLRMTKEGTMTRTRKPRNPTQREA